MPISDFIDSGENKRTEGEITPEQLAQYLKMQGVSDSDISEIIQYAQTRGLFTKRLNQTI